MRIIAFSDNHGSFSALNSVKNLAEKKKADYIVCTGDMSIFEEGLDYIMEVINRFPVPVLVIHGNHENISVLKKICKPLKNITVLHNKMHRDGNYVFLGWGGGGFAFEDKGFEKFAKRALKKIEKGDKIILLTHANPYGTKLDIVMKGHVGCKSIRNFIEKHQPVLALSGHIHDCEGKKDKVKRTKLMNLLPFGKLFKI